MNMKLRLTISILIAVHSMTAQEISPTRMTGSIGSVTLDGRVYNQISFRPEIPIGSKMAVGLDIYLYIDGDGNIYKDAWKFSDGKSTLRTILDKVYYFRYGQPEDDFYLRAGSLPAVTLGQGILVDGYSNIIEYPSVRRVGVNVKFKKDVMGFEAIASDVKRTPGVLGARASFDYIPKLAIGVSLVTDIDQNKGLQDRDGDDYPDVFDDFPDDKDQYDQVEADKMDVWLPVYENLNGTDIGFDAWFDTTAVLPRNPYDPSEVGTNPVTGAALDLTYRINNRVTLYSQFAQLIGDTYTPSGYTENSKLGYGFVPIGIASKWGPVNFRAEYRQNSRKFLFNYWNRSYDVTRATYEFETSSIITRESRLYQYGELKGFYIQANASLLELIHLSAGYQDMSGEVWDSDIQDYVDDNNKLFRTGLGLNTSKIPKIRMAEAFYQQSDVPNPFKFDPTPTTVLGYDIGIELSESVILVYKARRTYHYVDEGRLKPVTSLQFETRMSF